MWRIKYTLRKFVPAPVVAAYHFCVAELSALVYYFPSRRMTVIGVTGTKGKSSTTEMINAIFEASGHQTALLNSIRIKIGPSSEPNLTRMSMPGRFFIQNFLAKAERAGVKIAILEMTSEGARQYRHRGIDLDALVFTNLAPEHIESHGSYEAYADAKLELGKQLVRSHKRPRIMVANADDAQSPRYMALGVETKIPFTLSAQKPYSSDEHGGHFHFDDVDMHVQQPGEFSLKNALAATSVTHAFGISSAQIAAGLEKLTVIPGRAERIEAGQDFAVVVDYAHTPDSLAALYDAYGSAHKIGVLGATGGGRDLWKRPVMGSIADERCDTVILTNEDPYDEDPRSIVDALASGMKRKPMIIMDRREAIGRAIEMAAMVRQSHHDQDVAILITGKGTDPNIRGARGSSQPWSDAQVAREEIVHILETPNRPQSAL